jgi:hypothetical protein
MPNATPTDVPARSGSASLGVYPHVDVELEALLPDRIGDTPLIRMSAPGSEYDHGGDVCSFVCPVEARVMAEGVSASVADVTLAFAFDERLEEYALVAFRVKGASGADLLAARLALTGAGAEVPYPMVAEKRVGDDRITVAVRSWFPNDTEFLVVRDDALIVIRFPTPEHDGAEPTLPEGVARIVAALP